MKKLLLESQKIMLALIWCSFSCFLLFSCKQETKETKLIIINRCQAVLKDIWYGNEALKETKTLLSGESATMLLDIDSMETSRHLDFSIVDKAHDKVWKVSTKYPIMVRKTTTEEFTISDDLKVRVNNGDGFFEERISKLITLEVPTKLKLTNKTSFSIDSISYRGIQLIDGMLEKNSSCEVKFSPKFDYFDMGGTLSFSIWNSKENKPIAVQLREEIRLRKHEDKEVILTNSSIVTNKQTNEMGPIKHLLNMSSLEIINGISKANIKELKYAGMKSNKSLKPSEALEFDFVDWQNDFLEFDLETPTYLFWGLKTKQKVYLAEGENKKFRITDDLEVVDRNNTFKIQNLLDAAIIDVYNKTKHYLLDLGFKKSKWETVKPQDSVGRIYYSFDPSPGTINFGLKLKNGATIRLHTKETITLVKAKRLEFTITSNTPLVREDTNRETSISQLFD